MKNSSAFLSNRPLTWIAFIFTSALLSCIPFIANGSDFSHLVTKGEVVRITSKSKGYVQVDYSTGFSEDRRLFPKFEGKTTPQVYGTMHRDGIAYIFHPFFRNLKVMDTSSGKIISSKKLPKKKGRYTGGFYEHTLKSRLFLLIPLRHKTKARSEIAVIKMKKNNTLGRKQNLFMKKTRLRPRAGYFSMDNSIIRFTTKKGGSRSFKIKKPRKKFYLERL